MDLQMYGTLNTVTGNLPSIIKDGIYLVVLFIAFYFLYRLFAKLIKPPHKTL